MALEYTNRRGDRYFVYEGRTKTGKPKYFCSRKAGGVGVAALPPDFEIYEHPQSGLVSVRKIRPTRVLDGEVEFLAEQIRKLAGINHFRIDRSGDRLVVYVCDRDPDAATSLLEKMFGTFGAHAQANRDWIAGHAHYSPTYRFTLMCESDRLFCLDRWCYRSSVDGWLPLAPGRSLDELAADYLPHLGQESYFELI